MRYRVTLLIDVTDAAAVEEQAREIYPKFDGTTGAALIELFVNTHPEIGDPDGCELLDAEAAQEPNAETRGETARKAEVKE